VASPAQSSRLEIPAFTPSLQKQDCYRRRETEKKRSSTPAANCNFQFPDSDAWHVVAGKNSFVLER
jgi:hypothetical protein